MWMWPPGLRWRSALQFRVLSVAIPPHYVGEPTLRFAYTRSCVLESPSRSCRSHEKKDPCGGGGAPLISSGPVWPGGPGGGEQRNKRDTAWGPHLPPPPSHRLHRPYSPDPCHTLAALLPTPPGLPSPLTPTLATLPTFPPFRPIRQPFQPSPHPADPLHTSPARLL